MYLSASLLERLRLYQFSCRWYSLKDWPTNRENSFATTCTIITFLGFLVGKNQITETETKRTCWRWVTWPWQVVLRRKERGECLHQRPEQLLPLNFGYVILLVLPVYIMFGEGGKRTSNLSLLHILVTLNQWRLQYFLVVFVLACVYAEWSFLSLSLPVSLCEPCWNEGK